MARTSMELFDTFAARVAQILRERQHLTPETVLRVRRDLLCLEGRVGHSAAGDASWHRVQVTPEQLEWRGPDTMAEAFVAELTAAREAAK